MFVVDTNILIYAAEQNYEEHEKCRELLLNWREARRLWYVTWGIVYEFVRVTTHRSVFPTPWTIDESWRFVEALLAAPSLRVLEATANHADAAREVWSEVPSVRGNLVHDAHTAVLMREHGIARICTRDRDFTKFPFLEVVDPFEGSADAPGT